jgi:protease I
MKLRGKKIVVLVAEGFEDLEYWVTVMRLREEGAEVISVGPSLEPVSGKNFLEAKADVAADEVDPSELDGIVIPGGWAPDKLRRYPAVNNLVKAVYDRGKTVGIICHGGLVAISAGIVEGVNATGSLGIKDDLVNAGANWVDKPAFRENNLVWGRVVPDVPAFCRELVAALSEE